MSEVRRLIIVRPDDADLLQRLQRRYANDPHTMILYDRRSSASRRRVSEIVASNRRRASRRFPLDSSIIKRRGYVVVRIRPKSRLFTPGAPG
jgi:hypothetical protein